MSMVSGGGIRDGLDHWIMMIMKPDENLLKPSIPEKAPDNHDKTLPIHDIMTWNKVSFNAGL